MKQPLYQQREEADRAADRLRLFAQPQRLMLLSALCDGEQTVGGLEVRTQIGQPALSQQLAELRRAEILESRRAARQVYYCLSSTHEVQVREILYLMGDTFARADPLAQPAATPPVKTEGAARFVTVFGRD